jgi:hypothetical protein
VPNITKRDFSGGWRPGDDPINGAPNGMLQMDNVDLDTNGAINLSGGTAVVGTAYASNLHSIYSRTMGGTRKIYSADTAGAIFRDNTSIGTSGATDIAAFGTAFDYVLTCSGNTRKKDTGTGTPVNLGVVAPTVAPTVISNGFDIAPVKTIANIQVATVMYTGTASVITSSTYPSGGAHNRPAPIKYLQLTADATTGKAVWQTNGGSGDPHDCTLLVSAQNGSVGLATDNDVIPFYGYVDSPWGCSLQIDVLLAAGNAYADQISDYYSYKIDDLSTLQFDPYTGVFGVFLKRSDFVRFGASAAGWSTTYGLRISFSGAASQVINILGNSPNPPVGDVVAIFGGSKSQCGVYEFTQVNVNNTGSYLALSPMSPSTGAVILNGTQLSYDTELPSDTQVNEVWIYARSTGGFNDLGVASNLNKWYRVAKLTSALGGGGYVQQGDVETLTLNITYNQNLVSIASGTITDKILGIVGPINKRWYYFTTNMMYPSDIANPDLVDSSIAIRTTGSNNEIFLWAKQVDKATVLVGTSVDVYVLSGTFSTLPDFTIDIYYHGLGCKYPPITYDADVYSGNVFYLANDGWRLISASGDNELIVSPISDKLYRGITSNGYTAPNLKVAPGSARFPVVIARNKLWCFITGTTRCEVFDFSRKYWRNIDYGASLGNVLAATGTQDGQIVAFYSTDKKLREIDVKTTKLIDGVNNQTFNLKWVVTDGGTPRNRKDGSTFKCRCYTGGTDTFSVVIYSDLLVGGSVGTISSATSGLDKYLDISQNIYIGLCKTYAVSLTGFVADLIIEDWEISYELRPEQVSYKKILNTNFGNANKKRIRNWPLVIDTLGNTVVWTPTVDDVVFAGTNLSSTNKDTKHTFYSTDAFGIDYGGTLYCATGLFEFYEMLQPAVVQVLPIAKRFDQIGPEEFFKYGKIKQFELRVQPDGGSSIPYTIYFSDTVKTTGSISVTDGKEDSYFIDVSKGTNGRIVRVTFGPTSFNFHRFYVRMQVAPSGKDTELNWIQIANE